MPLTAQIDLALVYGSVARQQDTASSDVDVMIVSNTLAYGEVFGALDAASMTLGRKINPTLYTPADWAEITPEEPDRLQEALKQRKFGHILEQISHFCNQ